MIRDCYCQDSSIKVPPLERYVATIVFGMSIQLVRPCSTRWHGRETYLYDKQFSAGNGKKSITYGSIYECQCTSHRFLHTHVHLTWIDATTT